MNTIATIRTNQFTSIYLFYKGLELNSKNNKTITILFSDLYKIYIRKKKISQRDKCSLVSLSMLIIAISTLFISIELVVLFSLLIIPLMVKMNSFKRYQLNLQLNDGTFYIQSFNKGTKQEYINLVNHVRKEIFENQVKNNFFKNIVSIDSSLDEEYSFVEYNLKP